MAAGLYNITGKKGSNHAVLFCALLLYQEHKPCAPMEAMSQVPQHLQGRAPWEPGSVLKWWQMKATEVPKQIKGFGVPVSCWSLLFIQQHMEKRN